MKRFCQNNGLSIAPFGMFLFSFAGQYLTGFQGFNDDQTEHHQPTVGYFEYLSEGHFIEATFENWESEFLQMGMYVMLTVFLFQKGYSESKTGYIQAWAIKVRLNLNKKYKLKMEESKDSFLSKIT